MDRELVNRIESLFAEIERKDRQFILAIRNGNEYSTLKKIRMEIDTLKKELQGLELILFEGSEKCSKNRGI
jgi:hypothetical protein